jgi:NAD(P)H-hydrate epimerase
MKAPLPGEYQGYPVVSPGRMAELDQRASREYGIPALTLMENAGRAVAEEAAALLAKRGGRPLEASLITVCCGRGNNGGDGLAAARFLKEKGAEVVAFLSPPRKGAGYSPEVKENLSRAASAGVSVHEVSEELVELDVRLRSCDVIIDALLGTGSSGKPAGAVHKMIQSMMKAKKPILAVDIPSGLNPETGYHSGVIVTADVTCALGLPKTGLVAPAAARFVGELKVLDIGFPPALLRGSK